MFKAYIQILFRVENYFVILHSQIPVSISTLMLTSICRRIVVVWNHATVYIVGLNLGKSRNSVYVCMPVSQLLNTANIGLY